MATLLRRQLTARPVGLTGDPASRRAVVELREVRRTFGRRRVLHGVDLDIAPGEFVALLGASGSGKSTLLRIIAGLDGESTGRISVPARRAVVYQEHRLLPWKRVWRNVALGLPAAGRRAAAESALAEVGLEDRAEAWPLTLSGGEAQRAALARALVRRPDLLLLDEPFAALDALTRRKVQALVGQLWTEHRPAVFLVTHDVDEAISLADRVLVLERGRLAFDAAVEIDRPRDPGSAEFADLRRDLLGRLGVDTTPPPAPTRGTG
jgi:sulfonate transport system ATP-binding protein